MHRGGVDRGGLIDVVASDAHGPTRPPAMNLARRTLREVDLMESTAGLIGSTPHRLLALGMPSRRVSAA